MTSPLPDASKIVSDEGPSTVATFCGEGRSLLGSPLVAIEAAVNEGGKKRRAVLHVHKAVADSVPYFAAQLKRWDRGPGAPGGALRVDLPTGVSVEALMLVLEKTYFPAKCNRHRLPWRCAEQLPYCCLHPCSRRDITGIPMCLALQAAQMASMLDCAADAVEDLVTSVRDAVVSDADVAVLREFCEAHQVPESLSKLARRLSRRDEEGLDKDALRTMLLNSLKHNDSDMLKVATRLLKKRSRRGGSSLEEVADILATRSRETSESTEVLFQLALEFVEAHPRFYRRVVEALFSDEAPLVDIYISNSASFKQQKIAMAAKYFTSLLHVGLAHENAGTLCVGDLVALFERAVEHDTYISGTTLLVQSSCLATVAAALPRMGSSLQLEVVRVLTACEDARFSLMVTSEMLANLVVEAKSLFTARMLNLSDGQLGRVCNEQVIQHLARSVKIELCQKAYLFRPEVKSSLLQLLEPDESDSSDGF